MSIFIVFALWFLAAQALITAAQLLLRKKEIKPGVRVFLIIFKALTATALAALVMAGPVQLRAAQPFMMALYAALLMDAFADAVYSILCAVRKKERKFAAGKALSLIFGVLFFVYGVVNMQIVKPNYHTYTSDKLSTSHTVVFIADMHVGSAQPFRVTEKTVNEIKALHPDATILGGDIVDDYTTKQEMIDCFRLFADFDTPVYYLYGNHDRQGHAEYAGGKKFTQEELEQAIGDSGIVILKDEFVSISPDLVLLGREDLTEAGRLDVSSLKNPNPQAYLLVADHQPVAAKEHLALGMDLQLSGHTHAGQLFPLRALYSLIGGNVYGDYKIGSAVMNVSAGACGWRMPFRTEARCYYEVVTLEPDVK